MLYEIAMLTTGVVFATLYAAALGYLFAVHLHDARSRARVPIKIDEDSDEYG